MKHARARTGYSSPRSERLGRHGQIHDQQAEVGPVAERAEQVRRPPDIGLGACGITRGLAGQAPVEESLGQAGAVRRHRGIVVDQRLAGRDGAIGVFAGSDQPAEAAEGDGEIIVELRGLVAIGRGFRIVRGQLAVDRDREPALGLGRRRPARIRQQRA